MKDFKNILLKRREIIFPIEQVSNPNYPQVLSMIADKFKVGEDTIAVKSIMGSFGKHEFLINAFIYDSLEDKMQTEPRKKEKKSKEGAK